MKFLTPPSTPTIINTGTLTLPTSTDTLVGRATTDTLTNKTLTNPKINQINDTNGATEILLTATASSINYLNLVNGITGSDLQLQAAGTDTNTSINMVPKGTGILKAAGVAVATVSDTQTLTNKTVDNTSPTMFNPAGIISPYAGITAPTGWLLCNGAAVSRSTYATLFSLTNPSLGTTTMTIASPAVVTFTAHGLKNGDTVYFTTTGALPTGVTANTVYFITKIDANTFNLSTSAASVGAVYVNTSGTQSGTHTLARSLYGVGDGSTTFNVPDMRGRVIGGVEDMGGAGSASNLTGFAGGPSQPLAIGNTGGLQNHQLTVNQLASHGHSVPAALFGSDLGGSTYGSGAYAMGTGARTSGSTGSDVAHNNVQPTILLNYIIKV